MNNRLKATLKTSDLHERLAKRVVAIFIRIQTFYAYLRLINEYIHLLAENMGTSVHHLQRTVISIPPQAGTITKNMGFLQEQKQN